ncbi:hypothetical protein RHO13_00200 [Orbus wheelerorum]|uniref:hypothetical protein n=1 Tax=Orbus wheelerorum TaxID=3074111 RepID=UPI00370D9845
MTIKLLHTEPLIDEVIQAIIDFWGEGLIHIIITPDTLLEEDLGISGDDGIELLEVIEQTFNVDFNYPDDGEDNFRHNFDLDENEYLFTGEGWSSGCLFANLLDLLRLSNIPTIKKNFFPVQPIITDLSVRKLHSVICKIKRLT